ncbi:ATP-binding cassette domain-containing protein [Desulfopila sp. IMCC35006]|uniref:ATP-binding cassette domain-containing protein n=1 Tax=Desulfopila sp. IMCC35006 TaxID=2569542 RepID=UPI00267BEC5A
MMHLECSNITYSYPGTDHKVLDALTCTLSRPGFHSIFGPSGVGKSSFARLLADLNRHTFLGKIEFTEIQTVLYSYNLERLPGWSSAGAHLDKVVAKEKEALKQELINIFELSPLLGSRFHQLSMGQQNRINLIRYLLQTFDLLILDESLANVDEKLRQAIILTIKRIFPQKMFLYISHNLMEVSTFCDEILVFGGGSTGKSYGTIQGQNCCSSEAVDRKKVDETMLEIMNAF